MHWFRSKEHCGGSMAKVANVQKKIARVEGFGGVRFLYANGRDVRDNRSDLPLYRYKKGAPGNMTIGQWKERRFYRNFPTFRIEVFDSRGQRVNGKTLISNVRAW